MLHHIPSHRLAAKEGELGAVRPRARTTSTCEVMVLGGRHDLEVVGESYYQDSLWQVVGRRTTERVRVEIQAVLYAEADNPYDANAVSVWISGLKVGHLSRKDAAAYQPGLQARDGVPIALAGWP